MFTTSGQEEEEVTCILIKCKLYALISPTHIFTVLKIYWHHDKFTTPSMSLEINVLI
jgi:hypothetical protein